MSTNRSHPWLEETAIPFSKAIFVVLIFSPWLLLAYPFLTSYTAQLQPNDQEVIRGFIEWFGTAYSFFLALAVVNVWSQFDTVDREFDRELDAIAALLQTVRFTQVSNRTRQRDLDRFKDEAKADIERYLQHVIDNHRLEHKVHEHQRNGDRILIAIGHRVSSLTSGKVVPEPFIEELFKSLNEAMDVRGDRISHCKPYTPLVVKLVSLAASVTWLLSFLALVIYDKWVTTLLISGVAFVIIMVLVIFFDLSDPFGGIWKVHLDDWSEYLRTIDHDEDPQVIFVYSLRSTMMGWLRALVGSDTCKLYNLEHAKESREAWKCFSVNIQRPRPDGHPSIECLSCCCDQLDQKGLLVPEQAWPVVVLKRGGKLDVFMDSQAIQSCSDLDAFERLFHQNIKALLHWYEQ